MSTANIAYGYQRPWARTELWDLFCPAVSNEDDIRRIVEPGGKIFFVQWSSRLPTDILRDYECVGFHMTDLPYGRGGNPLQNLILHGKNETCITAFRVTEELDAGPVYLKSESFSILGQAEMVYRDVAQRCFIMAVKILVERSEPKPQDGEVVTFSRVASRNPFDYASLEEAKRVIDMWDASGYEPASITIGRFKIEFSDSCLALGTEQEEDELYTKVRITRCKS